MSGRGGVAITVRVLLADDHPALWMGLRALLDQAPDVEVMAKVESGEDALALIEALQPDVAVLDCQLPGLGGVEVAQEVARRGLPVQVLALSAYDYDRYVGGMLAAGAVGYLLKEEAPGAILAAVRGAAQGTRLWTEKQLARARYWQDEVERLWDALTEREREVLKLITQGKTDREIALALEISKKTVGNHVSSILDKLGVGSRTEAALWAVRAGFIKKAADREKSS